MYLLHKWSLKLLPLRWGAPEIEVKRGLYTGKMGNRCCTAISTGPKERRVHIAICGTDHSPAPPVSTLKWKETLKLHTASCFETPASRALHSAPFRVSVGHNVVKKNGKGQGER